MTRRTWTGEAVMIDFKAHFQAVRSIAFSPQGDRLATTGDEGAVKVWTPPDLKPLLSLVHAGRFSLTFSPDGRRLAWAGGGPYVLDLASRAFVFQGNSASAIVCR